MSTISIIGAGGMAAAIGGRITKAGYTVEVVSRDPAKARALADRLGAAATTGTYGEALAGDIVILAVPYTSAATVVAEYGDALNGKVIIDITNPINPDATGLVTPAGSSGAQEIAKIAPAGSQVVKAFNTLFGPVLALGGRLDAFIAADDAEAKARVSTFLQSVGLRPLDAGGLHMAQTLEALGLLMIGLARNGAGTWDIAMNIDIGSEAAATTWGRSQLNDRHAIRCERNGEISMSTQENVQIVKDFFAAIGRGDRQGLLALSAEDIEWIIPGEGWPLAGTHRGHAGLADVFQKASETIEISYPEPPEFVAQGDRVLVVGFARGRIIATNKTFEDHWVFAITVRNGKVTNIREYIDTQALARASERKT